MFLIANWEFGIEEMFLGITSLLTFLAIVVSLYLANRSKRANHKIIFKDNGCFQIINTGDIKFTISTVGYYLKSLYYYSESQQFIKSLSRATFSPKFQSYSFQEISNSTVVLEPGDLVETIVNFKNDLNINKRITIFIIINLKIVKKKMRINEISDSSSDVDIKNADKKNIINVSFLG
ncbi:MAG: hypothetical protein PHT83_03015 [Bacilli bacterium]|nr:hypothetical protein [Bacilli bacterium]